MVQFAVVRQAQKFRVGAHVPRRKAHDKSRDNRPDAEKEKAEDHRGDEQVWGKFSWPHNAPGSGKGGPREGLPRSPAREQTTSGEAVRRAAKARRTAPRVGCLTR